jgi:hypothetical protein
MGRKRRLKNIKSKWGFTASQNTQNDRQPLGYSSSEQQEAVGTVGIQ